MFKIGDTVSCQGFGLGTILDIENQHLGQVAQSFYVVANLSRTEKIKIASSCQGKIRELPGNKDVESILSILKGIEVSLIEGTNRTFYLNLVKEFKTGVLESISLVVKSLAEKTKLRKLRVEEKKLFDKAFKQLSEELAFVRQTSVDDSEVLIYQCLAMAPIK